MAASSPRVAVVDYGAGNLRSVSKALERSGFVTNVTREPEAVRAADCVVLPGVGAFADAMRRLDETGLGAAVREYCREVREGAFPAKEHSFERDVKGRKRCAT